MRSLANAASRQCTCVMCSVPNWHERKERRSRAVVFDARVHGLVLPLLRPYVPARSLSELFAELRDVLLPLNVEKMTLDLALV
jgi:hypothetical protein